MLGHLIPNVYVSGPDTLHANVWTPNLEGKAPVIVFIHGGSFTTGSNALAAYDGRRFAQSGVVFVHPNYRLGMEGFGWFENHPQNRGLLDQIAALEWVRDNIAAFGGDPSRVTLMGESAGAMSIGALLAAPRASGLFHRAILQSGASHHAISPDTARMVAKRLAEKLSAEATVEAIGEVSGDRLLAAQAEISAEIFQRPRASLWGELAQNLMPFEPVIDGDLLPCHPYEAILGGASREVDVLAGHNLHEAMLFLLGVPRKGLIPRLGAWLTGRRYGLGLSASLAYQRESSGIDVLSRVLTDAVYQIPATRLAEAHQRTWLYRFEVTTDAEQGKLRSCHTLELPYVFNNLTEPQWASMIGSQPRRDVAADMHRQWVAFASGEPPEWQPYLAGCRTIRVFGGTADELIEHDSRLLQRWDGRR